MTNEQIKRLMDDNFLTAKDLSYTCYTGQQRGLRKLAVEKFGSADVALLADFEIEKKFKDAGLIPMCIHYESGSNAEMIYLVPIQDLDKYDCLSR